MTAALDVYPRVTDGQELHSLEVSQPPEEDLEPVPDQARADLGRHGDQGGQGAGLARGRQPRQAVPLPAQLEQLERGQQFPCTASLTFLQSFFGRELFYSNSVAERNFTQVAVQSQGTRQNIVKQMF